MTAQVKIGDFNLSSKGEDIENKQANDLFELGLLIYEMAALKKPFTEKKGPKRIKRAKEGQNLTSSFISKDLKTLLTDLMMPENTKSASDYLKKIESMNRSANDGETLIIHKNKKEFKQIQMYANISIGDSMEQMRQRLPDSNYDEY